MRPNDVAFALFPSDYNLLSLLQVQHGCWREVGAVAVEHECIVVDAYGKGFAGLCIRVFMVACNDIGMLFLWMENGPYDSDYVFCSRLILGASPLGLFVLRGVGLCTSIWPRSILCIWLFTIASAAFCASFNVSPPYSFNETSTFQLAAARTATISGIFTRCWPVLRSITIHAFLPGMITPHILLIAFFEADTGQMFIEFQRLFYLPAYG